MGSVLGAVVSGVYQEDSNKRSIKAEKEENQLNREFNAEQAQLSRDLVTSEREASQAYQSAEWDRQQAYNTPAMQVKRLQEGGINPAVYFGGQGSVQGSSSVSAPSGSSSAPASYNTGVSPRTVQLPSFGDIGQFVKDIAEARKMSSETKTEDAMRDPMYRKALSSLLGQELANESMALANKFDKSSLDDRVKKAYWDAMESAAKVRLANTEDDLKTAETEYKQSMSELNYKLVNIKGMEGVILSNEVANWQNNFDSMMNVRKSEIQRNRAQASESSARATELASVEKLNRLDYEIKRNMQGALEGEYFQRWQNLVKEGDLLDWQVDCMESAAQQARVNASHSELTFWKDFILDVGESGFNAFLGYKNMRSWERLSKSAQENTARKIEQLKWEYGDKVSIEDRTESGAKRTRTYRRPYSKYGDATD